MTKKASKSKTIRLGASLTTVGVIAVILQILDQLKVVLEALNLEALPPNIAAWAMGILAVVGGLQIILRLMTSQPIENSPFTFDG